jgi:hypothetical protein
MLDDVMELCGSVCVCVSEERGRERESSFKKERSVEPSFSSLSPPGVLLLPLKKGMQNLSVSCSIAATVLRERAPLSPTNHITH